MATDEVHIVMLCHRPMAPTYGHTGRGILREEGDRRFAAKRREGSVPDVVLKAPELERTQIDVRQRDLGGRLPIRTTRDSHA
jgi:hypothetical protein